MQDSAQQRRLNDEKAVLVGVEVGAALLIVFTALSTATKRRQRTSGTLSRWVLIAKPTSAPASHHSVPEDRSQRVEVADPAICHRENGNGIFVLLAGNVCAEQTWHRAC
jgi:hypothetical protein